MSEKISYPIWGPWNVVLDNRGLQIKKVESHCTAFGVTNANFAMF